MGIRFYCPNGHRLHVKAFQAGRRGICPHCGTSMDIPLESTRPSSKRSRRKGRKGDGSKPGGASTPNGAAQVDEPPVVESSPAESCALCPWPVRGTCRFGRGLGPGSTDFRSGGGYVGTTGRGPARIGSRQSPRRESRSLHGGPECRLVRSSGLWGPVRACKPGSHGDLGRRGPCQPGLLDLERGLAGLAGGSRRFPPAWWY